MRGVKRRERTRAYAAQVRHGYVVAVQCVEEEGDQGEDGAQQPFWLGRAVRAQVGSDSCAYVVEGGELRTDVETFKNGEQVMQVEWYDRTGVVEGGWEYKLLEGQRQILSTSTLIVPSGEAVGINLTRPNRRKRVRLSSAELNRILGAKW